MEESKSDRLEISRDLPTSESYLLRRDLLIHAESVNCKKTTSRDPRLHVTSHLLIFSLRERPGQFIHNVIDSGTSKKFDGQKEDVSMMKSKAEAYRNDIWKMLPETENRRNDLDCLLQGLSMRHSRGTTLQTC